MIEIYNSNNNEKKRFRTKKKVANYIKTSLELTVDVPLDLIEKSGTLHIQNRHPLFIVVS